ncbi:MAG: hypothetical protein V9F03_13965 [Microthrixaceae bacterium]
MLHSSTTGSAHRTELSVDPVVCVDGFAGGNVMLRLLNSLLVILGDLLRFEPDPVSSTTVEPAGLNAEQIEIPDQNNGRSECASVLPAVPARDIRGCHERTVPCRTRIRPQRSSTTGSRADHQSRTTTRLNPPGVVLMLA